MQSKTSTAREALTPTKLWDHLVDSYRQNRDFTSFEESSERFLGGRMHKEPYYISGRTKDNRQIIITYPAHDGTDNEPSGRPIAEILGKVKDLLQVDGTILVPICQVNRFFGVGPKRMHFTMLEIHKDDTENISATHHDSKGLPSTVMYGSRIYSLEPIINAVRNAFPIATLTRIESGDQSIGNNVDCARFVIAEINQRMIEEEAVITEDNLQAIESQIQSTYKKAIENSPKNNTNNTTNRVFKEYTLQNLKQYQNQDNALEETKQNSYASADEDDFFDKQRKKTKVISDPAAFHSEEKTKQNSVKGHFFKRQREKKEVISGPDAFKKDPQAKNPKNKREL